MSRPATLTIAVVLQWIAAIFMLIAGVGLILGGLATLDESFRQAITDTLDQEGITDVTAGAISGGVLIAGFVVLAIAVIRAIVAVSLARGHNWARILITVFVVLGLLSAIGGLVGGSWLAIVSIVIEVLVLWLMWNGSSSAYIKMKTAERAVEAAK